MKLRLILTACMLFIVTTLAHANPYVESSSTVFEVAQELEHDPSLGWFVDHYAVGENVFNSRNEFKSQHNSWRGYFKITILAYAPNRITMTDGLQFDIILSNENSIFGEDLKIFEEKFVEIMTKEGIQVGKRENTQGKPVWIIKVKKSSQIVKSLDKFNKLILKANAKGIRAI